MLISKIIHCVDDILTVRQLAVLEIVATPGTDLNTVRGLAAAINAPKPSVVRALDKLQVAGFIRREPDPRDARSRLLFPTEAGAELAGKIADILQPKAARKRPAKVDATETEPA